MNGFGCERIAIMKVSLEIERTLHVVNHTYDVPGDFSFGLDGFIATAVPDDLFDDGINGGEFCRIRNTRSKKIFIFLFKLRR